MSGNTDYKIELEEFKFPADLEDHEVDFRLVVHFRYQHNELGYLMKSVVMPSLDLYWECSEKENGSNFTYKPERELVRAANNANEVDIQKVGDWGKVFRIQAIGLYEMRVQVFDVKHKSWWRIMLSKGKGLMSIALSSLARFYGKSVFVPDSDIEEKIAPLMAGLAEQEDARLLFTGSIKAPNSSRQGGYWSIESPKPRYVIKFKVSPE